MRPIVVVLAFALLACDKPKAQGSAPDAGPSGVDTVPVVSRMLNKLDHLPAQLAAFESVDIYPKVTGFVEVIRVDVGSRVKQGDLLVRLSAPELVDRRAQANSARQAAEAQLATAKAKLAADQGTYEHLEAASKTPGVVAPNDLAVAKQAVEADRGSVAAAEHNVTGAEDAKREIGQMESYLQIVAPFAGTITRRNLHPGALVGPSAGAAGGTPILQLVDTARLRLVVPVPEMEAAGATVGQDVKFSVSSHLGQTFHAPVARIAHDVDARTRTMRIEIDVENPDDKLAPGSFATVDWPVARTYPTLFVPTTAIATDQQRTFVVRITNGAAEWVNVQTGQNVGNEVEVVGDLHAGDQVVRTASDSIRSGDAVTARPAADAGTR